MTTRPIADLIVELHVLSAAAPAPAEGAVLEAMDMSESGHRASSWTRVYYGKHWHFDVDHAAMARLIVAAVNALPQLLSAAEEVDRLRVRHPAVGTGFGHMSAADCVQRSAVEHLSAAEADAWLQAAATIAGLAQEAERLRAGRDVALQRAREDRDARTLIGDALHSLRERVGWDVAQAVAERDEARSGAAAHAQRARAERDEMRRERDEAIAPAALAGQVRAATLREAADAWSRGPALDDPEPNVEVWLRERAEKMTP